MLFLGYEVVLARDGKEALDLVVAEHPDLVVLDLGMPQIDGMAVIEAIQGWSGVSILVVSGRTDSAEKAQALDLGADDNVTKPFATDELLARIRALARRRSEPGDDPVVRFADVTVELVNRGATRGFELSVAVRLTPTEWQMLEVLIRNPDKLITREMLLTEIWGPNHAADTGHLRLYVSQLRKKLEPEPAKPRYPLTGAGMGYRCAPDR